MNSELFNLCNTFKITYDIIKSNTNINFTSSDELKISSYFKDLNKQSNIPKSFANQLTIKLYIPKDLFYIFNDYLQYYNYSNENDNNNCKIISYTLNYKTELYYFLVSYII